MIMESTIIGLVIAFGIGILVGRSSLRSRADRLEAQLRQVESEASAQKVKINELISEHNEITDRYNAVILASAKPQKQASTAKEAKAVKSSNPTKTPSIVGSLKPRAGKPLAPMQLAAAQPVVVTRTSTLGAGVRAIDNWFEKTDWLANEDLDLKARINMGESVATIAVALGMDQKDVAYRATRLYFDEWGELDDKSKAPFDGTNWTKTQKVQFDDLISARKPLSEITKLLGRTKIAIGWRMIDNRKMRF
jgi:hypothetical protein